ncbi:MULTISPECIES: hypothetical protein [Streptomycetaceae]|uniref:hypothetical protein n=1 Tax=Streptomycetaceae TaxID=2062 RepID=UPI0004BD6391|nr:MULTISPECIES: hypothetical protein [Streptomycetaceae]
MRTRRLLLAAAALTAALALSGCSSSDSSDTSDSASSKPSAKPAEQDADTADAGTKESHAMDVKITKSGVEDHATWGPDSYVVHYKITNSGKESADYFAQFEFLDKDGDVLGSTGVTADKLGAGKSKTADAAPVKAEIENGSMTDIASVRVSQVDRT